MYLTAADIEKSGNWFLGALAQYGANNLFTFLFVLLLVIIGLGANRGWFVSGSHYRFVEKQLEASTLLLQSQDSKRLDTIEGNLDDIDADQELLKNKQAEMDGKLAALLEGQRELIRKLEGMDNNVRDIKAQGGGRFVG